MVPEAAGTLLLCIRSLFRDFKTSQLWWVVFLVARHIGSPGCTHIQPQITPVDMTLIHTIRIYLYSIPRLLSYIPHPHLKAREPNLRMLMVIQQCSRTLTIV